MQSKRIIMPLLSAALIICVWQILSMAIKSPLILPSFFKTAGTLLSLARTKNFYLHLCTTFCRVIAAFLISISFGSALGFFCGRFECCKDLLSFPLAVLRATPVAALILILVFSLSSSIVPVTSAVLMALPLVTTNISEAVEASAKNSKTKEMARIFGLTKKQRLLYILLPNLSPSLKASAVSSFGMTWKVVAAGEILCLPRTAIGSELAKAQVHLETSQVLAYTLTLIITSYFFESLLKFLCREKGHAPASKKPDPKNYMPQIFENERLALIAPSGFGKTTLLDYLSKTNESVSYSFQDNRLLEELTVIQNIAIPLFRIFSESEAKEKSLYYIEKTFLSGKKDLKVKYLSGGEKQRVALARALAYPSKLLLLDESFNAQDYELKMSLMNFVKKELDKNPRTLVFVTHDERDANFLCSRVAKLHSSANFNDSIEKNRLL